MSVSRYPSDATSSKNYVAMWAAGSGATVDFGAPLKQNANYYVYVNGTAIVGPNVVRNSGLIHIPAGDTISSASIGGGGYPVTSTAINTPTSGSKYFSSPSYEVIYDGSVSGTLIALFSTNSGQSWTASPTSLTLTSQVGHGFYGFGNGLYYSVGFRGATPSAQYTALNESLLSPTLPSRMDDMQTPVMSEAPFIESTQKMVYPSGNNNHQLVNVHDLTFSTMSSAAGGSNYANSGNFAFAVNGNSIIMLSSGRTSSQIFLSTNGGTSFNNTGIVFPSFVTAMTGVASAGSGIFVAQDFWGHVRYSQDGGVNWASSPRLGATNNASTREISSVNNSVIYSYVPSESVYYFTTNGSTWATSAKTSIRRIVDVKNSPYGLMLSGASSPYMISLTTDGVTWNDTAGTWTVTTNAGAARPYNIMFASGKGYVAAVGDGSTNSGSIAYSTDLLTWASALATSSFVGNFYISTRTGLVGAVTPSGNWASKNLSDWSQSILDNQSEGSLHAVPNSFQIQAATMSGNEIILGMSTAPMKASTDGYMWYSFGTGSAVANTGMVKTGISNISAGKYIYVTTGGGVFVSTNTTTWSTTSVISGSLGPRFITIASGSGQIVVGGLNGFVYTSTDAITWTARATGLAQGISNLQNGPEGVIASGTGETQFSVSTDGIGWSVQDMLGSEVATAAYNPHQAKYVTINVSTTALAPTEYYVINPYTAMSLVYNGRVLN